MTFSPPANVSGRGRGSADPKQTHVPLTPQAALAPIGARPTLARMQGEHDPASLEARAGRTAAGAAPRAVEPAAAPAGEPVVRLEALRVVYRGRRVEITALDGVDLSIEPGQFLAIMGASGSGKSTLLHATAGLILPTAGRVIIEGHDLGRMSDRQRTIFRRRRLGIVFQEYNLLPTLTAAENIALPWLIDNKPWRQIERRVRELLALVHLEPRADHTPDALSGGEKQRVAFARALLNDPAILLADEPTGNLDSKQSLELWRLMRRICDERGCTILMVTHEAQGAAFADKAIVLRDGRICGQIEPKGSGDAALVANRYQELMG